jgi:hypothetical protein
MPATSGISTIPNNMQTRKIKGARINIKSTKWKLTLPPFRKDNSQLRSAISGQPSAITRKIDR